MNIRNFSQRWNLPAAAEQELEQLLHAAPRLTQSIVQPPRDGTNSEAENTHELRIEASKRGVLLWRNNVGVATSSSGRPVRYGLSNESAAQNNLMKSSDFVGITPILICGHHVGSIIGAFTAYEVKKDGWKYSGTEREAAQLRFCEAVSTRGGIAGIGSTFA